MKAKEQGNLGDGDGGRLGGEAVTCNPTSYEDKHRFYVYYIQHNFLYCFGA